MEIQRKSAGKPEKTLGRIPENATVKSRKTGEMGNLRKADVLLRVRPMSVLKDAENQKSKKTCGKAVFFCGKPEKDPLLPTLM